MGKLLLTSDTHFGHRLVAQLRGYDSPDEHDAAVCDNWHATVTDRDTVWVLGDISIGGTGARHALALLADLPGTKHLVLGNHESIHPRHSGSHKGHGPYREVFASISTAATLKRDGRRLHLSHFPYAGDRGEDRYTQWRLPDEGTPILHGHVHTTDRLTHTPAGTPQIHVGLDAWNHTPISIETALALLDT